MAGEVVRDIHAVTCMEVLRIMQGTREDKALVAAVRGTVIEAKDAAARKAAAVDAEARKAAEERAEAKAAAARKAAGKGVEELGVEFARSSSICMRKKGSSSRKRVQRGREHKSLQEQKSCRDK